jgi:hypothetical protein
LLLNIEKLAPAVGFGGFSRLLKHPLALLPHSSHMLGADIFADSFADRFADSLLGRWIALKSRILDSASNLRYQASGPQSLLS